MENRKDWQVPQEDTDQRNDWQLAENDAARETSGEREDSTLDLRSAEAGGYGTNEDADEALYATGSDDDPEDDNYTDDDNEDDDDDDDNHKTDWGNVDPLSDTDGIPDGTEPSGPGSAV